MLTEGLPTRSWMAVETAMAYSPFHNLTHAVSCGSDPTDQGLGSSYKSFPDATQNFISALCSHWLYSLPRTQDTKFHLCTNKELLLGGGNASLWQNTYYLCDLKRTSPFLNLSFLSRSLLMAMQTTNNRT